MSIFSGKCDLYDHISFEKTYDCGKVMRSDELECFNIFKRKTNGKIYRLITVNSIDDVLFDSLCKLSEEEPIHSYYTQFKFHKDKHVETVVDKRTKSGTRDKVSYTYCVDEYLIDKWFEKSYSSLKDLNEKFAYQYRQEIEFDNIFDLIPYYPYIVKMSYTNKDTELVYISNESFVDKTDREFMSVYGKESRMSKYYKHNLQQHYKELIDKYKDKLFDDNYTFTPPEEWCVKEEI